MNRSSTVIERIEVTGIVQGVGFRPFVHGLATRAGLGGYVLNTPDGVVIEVEGPGPAIDRFADDLASTAPPLARIVDIRRSRTTASSRDGRRHTGFKIRRSGSGGGERTLVPPDSCVCDDCRREMFTPSDRRYLYPFINCTNCGPRFTIIRDLPYDRPMTTMNGFVMCPDCAREYADSTDRRFHAQPNACPVCGPRVSLVDASGTVLNEDPMSGAIDMLRDGLVVAVKGLGGFHLGVDGTNEKAVRRLRDRKHREEKPLALMVASVAHARRFVRLEPPMEQLLAGQERPIVIAPRLDGDPAAPSVAPGNGRLGVMLPYTPLHYLLMYHPDAGGDSRRDRPLFDALVMTSGNVSDEPICRDNDEARERLAGIADAFLVHDRPIHVRCDDSVVTSTAAGPAFIRRSRGFVPVPVFLADDGPPVMAFGPELKNTLCITGGRRAFMSQHIGDLENLVTLDTFREAAEHFMRILDVRPRFFAHDLHPDYLSTRHCMDMLRPFGEDEYGAAGVQHHHAHIAGVMAENGVDGPVIGLSFDGTGLGTDRTVWGGELLVCTQASFTRVGHILPVPLPGGEKAIREPWRTAFSWLRAAFGDDWRTLDLPPLSRTSPEALELIAGACTRGINAPLTSSLGRLFDAVSGILGLGRTVSYEGQAAIRLDLLADGADRAEPLGWDIVSGARRPLPEFPVLRGLLAGQDIPPAPSTDTTMVLDYRRTIRDLTEGIGNGIDPARLALGFHEALMASFLAAAERLRDATGIGTVALSGGSWQNRTMNARFPGMLSGRGFIVLTNRLVPVNDGGASLGQACIVRHIARLAGFER